MWSIAGVRPFRVVKDERRGWKWAIRQPFSWLCLKIVYPAKRTCSVEEWMEQTYLLAGPSFIRTKPICRSLAARSCKRIQTGWLSTQTGTLEQRARRPVWLSCVFFFKRRSFGTVLSGDSHVSLLRQKLLASISIKKPLAQLGRSLAVQALARVLQKNRSIAKLGLQRSKLDVDGLKAFWRLSCTNPKIDPMHLGGGAGLSRYFIGHLHGKKTPTCSEHCKSREMCSTSRVAFRRH